MKRRFDWDGHNTQHVARHGLTPEEVEQVLLNDPLELQQTSSQSGESRILCAGKTDAGKPLCVVYTERAGRCRVVTAYHASRKLRKQLQW